MSITNMEVKKEMPFRDGTGPMGAGAGTGRGMGGCFGTNLSTNAGAFGMGMRRGRGCNHGFGYRNFVAQPSAQTRRAVLADRKQLLEQQLAAVNKSLESENE